MDDLFGAPSSGDGEREESTNEEFLRTFEEHLSNDAGYATETKTVNRLAEMYISDRANYARVEAILRTKRVLGLVRDTVRDRVREIRISRNSTLRVVPESDRPPPGPSVVNVLRGAPVDKSAVFPSGWIVGPGAEAGRHALIKEVIRKKGDETVTDRIGVAYTPLVVTSTMRDICTDELRMELGWPSKGRWLTMSEPASRLAITRDCVESLGSYGYPVNTNNVRDVIEYITDYSQTNREYIPERKIASQMGWQGQDGSLGFVSGNRHLSESGARDIEFLGSDTGDDHISACLTSNGTLEGWSETVETISQYPSVMIGVYASLATPLLEILSAPNFVIDWSYKTSTGKTTALRAAASVWGCPDPHHPQSLIASWDMTQVGFERRATVLSGLPLIVDDTKRARSVRGESLVPSIIYAVTNGAGRVRGSVRGIQRTRYWRTIMLSTGEQRAVDFDKSGGAPARCVSLWGNPFGEASEDTAAVIAGLNGGLAANHGHAGPAFVEWLCSNRSRWGEFRIEYEESRKRCRSLLLRDTDLASCDLGVVDRMASNLAVLDTCYILAQEIGFNWMEESPVDSIVSQTKDGASTTDREVEALKSVSDFAHANMARFIRAQASRSEEPNGGWLGYWQAASLDAWDMLCFFPHVIRDLLTKMGHEPNSIARRWREMGWVEHDPGRSTLRITDLDGRPRMIAIRRSALVQHGCADDRYRQ